MSCSLYGRLETKISVGSSDGIINSLQKGNSNSFSVEEIQKAFEMVADYQDGVIKAMVNFS